MLFGKTLIQGIINLVLTAIIMLCAISIFVDAVPKWIKVIQKKKGLIPEFEPESEPEEELV